MRSCSFSELLLQNKPHFLLFIFSGISFKSQLVGVRYSSADALLHCDKARVAVKRSKQQERNLLTIKEMVARRNCNCEEYIRSDVKWEKCILSCLRPSARSSFQASSSALRQLRVGQPRCVFARLSRVSPCLCPLPPVVGGELLPKCHSELTLLSSWCVVDASQERRAGTVRLNHRIDWRPDSARSFISFCVCRASHLKRWRTFSRS